MTKMTVTQFIEKFDAGEFDATDISTQIKAGWFDWFCRDTSLAAKTQKLAKKLKMLVKVQKEKFDPDTTYVFFKNNFPMSGSLYDDFRICDIKTGDVIFTVIPSRGQLWGAENDFDDPMVEGSWKDIKAFFKGE